MDLSGLSDHRADSRFNQWLNCQEPRTTPEEALVGQFDQGPDPESNTL